MNVAKHYVIGVDYGTDSVRSLLVDASNGNEIASSVYYYSQWKEGKYCDPSTSRFRQHPQDYIDGLERTIRACLHQAGGEVANNVRGVSIDTTGSSPVAVDKTGTPLALLPAFSENPNAMFVLWKDHTAVKEAAEINEHATKFDVNYLQFVGGIYSSEWFWAKLLHVIREDEALLEAMASWVEHCDWIPFLLTGGNDILKMKRGICAAGHKSLFADGWGGLPPEEWFTSLDPLLQKFSDHLFSSAYTADTAAGNLSPVWAKRLGLSTQVVVGVGAFDAHMGAVGGQIEPYHLSKVMGTSTCDMLVAPTSDVKNTLVAGICGQVPGSIIPGMIGMEAGQSAFGDAYAWFRSILSWPLENLLSASTTMDAEQLNKLVEESIDNIIPELSKQAALLPLDEEAPLALDWFNGRRTPDANQSLLAAFIGLDLGTNPPVMFRAIAEATCFGAKAIVDRFREQKIPVKGLIGMGGVAKKSPLIMQMMADVMNMPIRIHKSEQTCALGAAMFAATAAGLYQKVEQAMEAMGPGFDVTYEPNKAVVGYYEKRYEQYKALGTFVEDYHTGKTTLKSQSQQTAINA